MNSREEFLKSLKVNNSTNNREQRYTSKTKVRNIANKKQKSIYKRALTLFMAGVITGAVGCYYFNDSEPQHVTNRAEITMTQQTQNVLPEEIFFHNKAEYELLQKNIYEYKLLDDIFFKNDDQEKRFTELQETIADQNKLVEQLYLNLIKHKVAKDNGVKNLASLTIRPNFVDASPRHIVYNSADDTKILYDKLGEPVLDAITDIQNFQSRRAREGTTIALKDKLKIRSLDDYEKYVVTNAPLMADMVVNLNDSMTKFSKVIEKDQNSKNKDFDEGR